MQFSTARFNAHIKAMGQRYMWRRADACPCFNPSSGHGDQDCAVCSGKGVIWAAEVEGWAGATSQNSKKIMAQFGVYEAGDTVLTIGSDSPLYALGQFDRVRALNATNPFSKFYTRGENDKLVGSIVSISRVFWLNPAKTAIVEGGIPTFNAAGVMTWTTGEPPAGVQYTVNGIRHDEYFVFPNLTSDRNMHDGVALPRKLLVRRFDLFGR